MNAETRPSLLPYTIPENPSPKFQRMLAYIAALREWDYEKTMSNFDHSLQHQILPSSLGHPVRNFEEYGQLFSRMITVFKSFKVVLHEVIESENEMAVHVTTIGESITGELYANEQMLFLRFAPVMEQGGQGGTVPKISGVKELVDSQLVSGFFSRL